jgi:hypothetical protein
MHSGLLRTLMLSTLVMVGACSTAQIQSVEMDAFTTSMSENLTLVDAKVAALNLPERIADDRRAQLITRSGFYELEDCVLKPSALLTNAEDLSAPYFDDRCKLNGLDKQADAVPYVMAAELDRAVAAQRTSSDLKDYLNAISELGGSDQPNEVANNLAASLDALNRLAESAAAFGDKKIDKNVTNTVEAGSTLAQTLAREGLEAMRYNALAAVVRDADPAVYEACIQLALWMAEDEDETLKSELRALQDAADEATTFAVSESDGGVADQQVLATKLKEVERRYKTLADHDHAAKWRVFITAAQAHRALRDAFDRPADIEAAANAHARLDTLVNQTIAVLKAAENQ